MTGRSTFSVIVFLVAAATTVLIANLQRPMVDPVQAEPAATSTRWTAPILHTATISPTLLGGEGGWFSQLPTPVPASPRVVSKKTQTPTYEDNSI
jgi:hypothetical protein